MNRTKLTREHNPTYITMEIAKRKKILYLITKSNMGGAQRYVYDLATSLPADHYEAVVALGGTGPLKTRLEEAGIRTISIDALQRDVSIVHELNALRTIYRIIRSERPDVLHLNSPKAGGLGGVAGRALRVPKIIFTGHGWGFNEARPRWQKPVIRFFQWLIIMCAHTTIAVSQKTAIDVQSLPFVARRLVVIHNGIKEWPLLSKDEARRILSAKTDPTSRVDLSDAGLFLVGMVAELHQNKGIDLAIRALAPLLHARSSITLAVVGDGEERARLSKQIDHERLKGSVQLLGPVDNARDYLAAFDMFLMPSRTEALPYALLEAGMAHMPVVASNVGGIPEIITHRSSGLLVNPYDAQAIYDAVLSLANSADDRKLYADGLAAKVRTEFSFDSMLSKTYAQYTA